jgi:hypothetical protein
VQFITDQGFIGTAGQRSARVPVAGNTAQVTFVSEAVDADITATVRVEAANPQGNIVAGTVQITMTLPPKPPILQPLQVATTTLSVSSSNDPNPNARTALGPEPNRTTVTVLVQEQDTNLPVRGAVVTLSSSDPNGLWVDANNNASLGGIRVTTGSDGRAVVTYYTSKDTPEKKGEGTVTLTATLGKQKKTAEITVRAGNPANVTLTINGANTAPADGVPFIFVPGAGTPNSATITATVKDAAGNAVRDGTQVTFTVVENEGNFDPTNQVATSGNVGQAQVTLRSSQATGEFTVQAQAGSATGTAKIRYAADVPNITSITANPTEIPDDGQETSTITVQFPAPDGTRFRISTNLGVLISGSQTGSAVVATVSGGQAQVQFRGPGTSTTRQTATVTAEIVGRDGSKKSKSTTIDLLPRIEVIATFRMTAPNRLVVSSSNSTDPGQRQPLDGIPNNNRATIQVVVRGQAPSNRVVSLLASEGNILFEVTQGSNQGTKQLATVTGNLVQVGSEFRYTVNMYSSTLAGNFTVRVDVPGLNNYNTTIPFTQLAGPPGAIVVSAASDRIGVQGHPTLPTSTTITAIVRDAVGNPIDGAFVFFSADDGVLNPIAASTQNGTATTTLTSSNFTRRVRVFGKVIGVGGQEITNFTLVNFVVGNLASIDLVPDRTDIPPNEVANVTVLFNPAGEMPNNVRFSADLVGAYGVLESVSTTLNGRATVRIRNNNPTNANQPVQLTVRAIRQDGLELTKSLSLTLLPSQVVAPVELQTNPSRIVVSNNDATTNPTDRASLSTPGTNIATLTLFVRGLNAGETVSVTLDATDPRGLFVPPAALNVSNSVGTLSFNITDNGAGDGDPTSGTIRVLVNYYSSRKAQPVTIRAKVNRGAQLYGESAVGIFQVPGPVAKAFFAVDPPRLAINTMTGEPIEARLIASVYDANDNPVPNERVSFAIDPVSVVPQSDIQSGGLTLFDPSLSRIFRAYPGAVKNTNIGIGNQPPDPFDTSGQRTFTGGLPNSEIDPRSSTTVIGLARGSVVVRTTLVPSQGQTIGTGDGTARTFQGTLTGAPILRQSVRVTAGNQSLQDDGQGRLTGDGQGAVNYDNGAISVTFNTPPPAGQGVNVYYRQVVNVELRDDGNGQILQFSPAAPNYLISGSVVYITNTGTSPINVNFNTPVQQGVPVSVSYRIRADWDGGTPRSDAYLGFLPFVPGASPLVSDGSIFPQAEAFTDINGIAVTNFRSANISQPVRLRMVPTSNPSLAQTFDTFYYIPVQNIEVRITQGAIGLLNTGDFEVEFRFNPATALPLGSRVWVRIYGTLYDGDDDRDGLVNEDPPGALNPDQNKDGLVTPGETPVADDDGDGRSDEDPNPERVDVWVTNDNDVGDRFGIRWANVSLVAPGVVRVHIFNRGQGPNPATGWKVIQIFCWNRDGIRLLGQTSKVLFQ